ncbi:MAG: radical SAM protein [bacterium]
MANLSITSKCNRACSYCFAMEKLGKLPDLQSFMSLTQYERALHFLQRSGINEVRLLGGEPTLHPQFLEMIQIALARQMRLLIFTGGLVPNKVLHALKKMKGRKLKLLLNLLHPQEGKPSEHARQRELCKQLGNCVMPGINIFSPGIELDFILDLIQEYGLIKCVRLGLSHPDPESRNEFLHPNHYPQVGLRATEFAVRARKRGVSIDFDCGWVPCMFPEGAMEYLGMGARQVGLTCSPIIDILANGQTISCYPLFKHVNLPLPEKHNAVWLRTQYARKQAHDRQVRLHQYCAECTWMIQNKCSGGCLAASMRRYRRIEFNVSTGELQNTIRMTAN